MIPGSVSVIIPCFNQGRFLREALDSVRAQTRPAREVVVVDDGSTDGTWEIATSHPGVTCIRQPNRGLAHARNRGVAAVTSDYVVFLDADDRLLPEAVAIGAAELDRWPHHAMVYGRCERIDQEGQRLPTVAPPLLEGDAYEMLLRNNVVWTPAVAMLRRSVCQRSVCFNPAVGPSADYELYLTIAREGSIRGHGQLVAEYRLHHGSMSSDAALMLRSTVRVLRGQRRFVEGHDARMAAYEYGLRSFRHHYGDQLAAQIRTDWKRPSRWPAAIRAAGVLLRYHPGGVLRQIGRYLYDHAARLRRVPNRSVRT